MYESFYGLTDNPFRLVPDARFYFDSDGHKRGMAYLRYGLLQGQGFVVITGKPGTGKSTLVEALFAEMPQHSLIAATLVSTNLEADEILQAVVHCFDISSKNSGSKAALLNAIEDFLRSQADKGKRVILVVDEAQNLPPKSLEELRMLSNFLQQNKPLMQIILLGQHQLNEMLARPDMEQLCQRVIASCHLGPLSAEQTRDYIAHRLKCAGWHGRPALSSEVLGLIFAISSGIPRLINIFCDRLFLSASLESKNEIDLQLAYMVHEELKGESTGSFCGLSVDERDQFVELDSLPGADFAVVTENNDLDDKQPESKKIAEIYDDKADDFVAANQDDEFHSKVIEHKFVEEQLSALSALAAEKINAYETVADEVEAEKVETEKVETEKVEAEKVSEVIVDNQIIPFRLQEQENLQNTVSSPVIQFIRISSDPVYLNPGPWTPEFAYKKVKLNAPPETPVSEVISQRDKLEEILKNYPTPQYDQIAENNETKSSNRSLIWPLVFVGGAMVVMLYFSDDVREFSQRFKFPAEDSISIADSSAELNSNQQNSDEEKIPDEVFVQEQFELEPEMMIAPTESPSMSPQMAETEENKVLHNLPESTEKFETPVSDVIPSNKIEGHVSTRPQAEVVSIEPAVSEPEADIQTKVDVNFDGDKQAVNTVIEQSKPKVVSVVDSKVQQPQIESVSKPEPDKAQKNSGSVGDLPLEKTLTVAKSEIVEQVPVQKADMPAPKQTASSVDVIIPQLTGVSVGKVLPAKIGSDIESENLNAPAVLDTPPVVEADVIKAEISEFELTNLLYDLVAYYESGDLSGFISLFADDVVVDGVEGRDSLRQDYQALFDATDMRQMQLDTLQWEYLQDHVQGFSEFVVTVWRKRGRPSMTQEGILKLGIVKRGDILAIKTMAYELK